jgi:toxin CptA
MWSNRFATPLVVRPEPSRRLAGLLWALHGIAAAGLLAVSPLAGLAGGALLLVSLAAHLRAAGWFGGRTAVKALRVEPDGGWRVMHRDGVWTGVRVSPQSLCLPGLCVLRLHDGVSWHVLALAGDSLDDATFRQLRSRLLALDPDSLVERKGIGERLRRLGILKRDNPAEHRPMPADQERLEALLSDDPDPVDTDEEPDAIEVIDAEKALRIDRTRGVQDSGFNVQDSRESP